MRTDRYDYAKMARLVAVHKKDAGLSDELILATLQKLNARLVHLGKYEPIANQGDRSEIFGLVVRGNLQLSVISTDGSRTIMRAVRTGEFIGHSLIHELNPVNPCSAVAYLSCDVIVFDLDAARKCQHDPMSAPFFQMLENQLRRSLAMAWQRNVIVSQRSLAHRIMTYLMIRSSEDNMREIQIPGTMDDFADFLVCERSALSRELSRLSAKGKIRRCGRGRIRLLDTTGFTALTEELMPSLGATLSP